MKLQLSPTKKIPGVFCVWQEGGPEVDLTADVRALTFAPGSIEEMYSFHVLDHLFPEEVPKAAANWKKLLKPGGKLYIVVDDFETIARSFVGGDFNVDIFNQKFSHPTQFTRDNLVKVLQDCGFEENNIVLWFADVGELFKREPFDLIISAQA